MSNDQQILEFQLERVCSNLRKTVRSIDSSRRWWAAIRESQSLDRARGVIDVSLEWSHWRTSGTWYDLTNHRRLLAVKQKINEWQCEHKGKGIDGWSSMPYSTKWRGLPRGFPEFLWGTSNTLMYIYCTSPIIQTLVHALHQLPKEYYWPQNLDPCPTISFCL